MKRVLLDTNIYEHLLKGINREILEKHISQNQVIFYGMDVIRKELRAIPKKRKETVGGAAKNLRNALLGLYDTLVGKHHLMAMAQMEEMASKYYLLYNSFGGKALKHEIIADFTIIACASLHELDIVFSEDSKTMISGEAVKSYHAVNLILGFKTPSFYRFRELKKMLGGGSLD